MDRESQASDEALVAQAKAGDKQAFVVLFNRHEDKIYNYLARYIGDDHKAQDLTIETFLNVHNNLRSYTEEGKFLSWVYKIATNLAKTEFRKRKNNVELSLDQPLDGAESGTLGDLIADELNRPDHSAMRSEVAEIVGKALMRLREAYRQVVILCDIEGFTHEEAAKILHSNVKTVGTHLKRARAVLYMHLLKFKNDL